MTGTTETTIDSAGRLVIPKSVRTEAGLEPGMHLRIRCHDGVVEIEVAPRVVHPKRKGHVCVAVPARSSESLDNETVRQVVRSVRDRDPDHE
ncbi:MAG: hypothetical protein K8R59_05835 [Thermoanaerobaculales bacterium]|nr:hypothetical protein [Thermoanaerobaculales bacterium]